tara:strand:+ start:542 stop:775 length:234 start_codon:yes stop_codon:yes gene_type:complete
MDSNLYKLKNMKSSELCNPSQETWFICWDNERVNIKAYSSVIPTGCLDTFWDEVDYFTNEAEWLEVLLENGINPDNI